MSLNDHWNNSTRFKSNEKRILVVVHTNTFFVELFRLSKLLNKSGEYHPVVLFANPYPTWIEDASKCLSFQISCLDSLGREIKMTKVSEPMQDSPSFTGSLKSLFVNFLKLTARLINSMISWRNFIRESVNFFLRFLFVNRVLAKQDPAILVLGGDMVGYDSSVFIKGAHDRSIPVTIVPSTMSNGLEQAEAYFYDEDFSLKGWVNRLAGYLYPQWVMEHRGQKILRVPGERVFLMELLGLAPPLPWIFNSGFADAIACESLEMKRYYMDCGLPENQLQLVGSLADDDLFGGLRNKEQYKSKISLELGLDQEKPLLLSALPPDSLYMIGGRPECDFSSYKELVEFWVKSIASVKNYNVVLCLHPSVKIDDFKYLENFGINIAGWSTSELIPLCDIYVASVSSTIRWAIACGIPVVNYDVYRYRYTDYIGVDGVISMEEKNGFTEALLKLANDPAYYSNIAASQQSHAGRWGRLDGRAGERLQDLFLSLISKYNRDEKHG